MRINRIIIHVAVAAAILSTSRLARATGYTWTGGDGSSNSWYSTGNWQGSTVPLDEPPGDYLFAASGWNASQTTIAIDGMNHPLDVKTLTFNENADVPITIQIDSGNSLHLSPSSSGATTISVDQTGVKHTIAGGSGATIQLSGEQQWSVDGALEISAVIWDEGESPSPGFVKTGAGTLTLSGNNWFCGPISIDQGVICVSTIADKGHACNLGKGDLALNGGVLRYIGTGQNISTSRGFTLGEAGGAIDVQNASTSLTFTGAATGGQAGLTKAGSGTLKFTAANNYIGVTTVENGTLELATAVSQNPVFNLGGADIQNGKMVFNYSAGGGPALDAQIKNILAASYGTAGQIPFDRANAAYSGSAKTFSTNAAAKNVAAGKYVRALGWFDNTTTSQIKVMYTIAGDCTGAPDGAGDGIVGGPDLTALLANFGKPAVWATGDFNYDGTCGGPDLTLLLANFGQSALSDLVVNASAYHNSNGEAIGMLSAAGFTLVPEPSSIILLATVLFAILAIAWRMHMQKNIRPNRCDMADDPLVSFPNPMSVANVSCLSR